MGVNLDSDRLKREARLRGWSNTELADRASVSRPTITAAMRGRAVSPRTLRLIAQALVDTPPVEGIEALLMDAR